MEIGNLDISVGGGTCLELLQEELQHDGIITMVVRANGKSDISRMAW